MSINRIWQLGAAIVGLGILALGWFLGVSPQLDAASESAAQTADLKATNDQTQAVIAKLTADERKLPSLKTELARLLTSVPDSASMPAFVDEIGAGATTAGVQVMDIKVSDAQPYQPATPPATSSSSTSSTSTTSSGSATPAPTATAAATPAAGMPPITSPLVTPQSMAVIPVDITVKGDYPATLKFVKSLQSGSRLYLVTKLTSSQDQSDTSGGPVTVTVSGYLYSLTGPATTPVPTPTH